MQKIIKYFILTMMFLFSSVLYALEAGDLISNTATVNYTVHGVSKKVNSNTLTHTIEESEAEISFLYPTKSGTQTGVMGTSAYRDENGVWQVSDSSTLADGTVIGNDSLVNLEETGFYGTKDTAIIKVVDADQNVDRNVRDIIEVTITTDNGDTEVLRLRETTADSGVFMGYIVLTNNENKSYDNSLYVEVGETIVANYDNDSIAVKSDSAVVVLKKEFNIWIEKQVNKTEASVGELLEYTLTVHNDEEFKVDDLTIYDALPLGLKYKSSNETVKLSADGKTLEFAIDSIEANSKVEVTFIASC